MRLDQVQHELGRNRRIHRAAARSEHAQSGVHRERMGRGDHVFARVGDIVFAAPRRRLGLQGAHDLGRSAGREHEQGDAERGQAAAQRAQTNRPGDGFVDDQDGAVLPEAIAPDSMRSVRRSRMLGFKASSHRHGK